MNRHLALCALVLGLGAVPLAARPHRPSWGPARHGAVRQEGLASRFGERLQLTESQKAQIQAIRVRHATAAKDKAQAAFEAATAFRNAAHDPGTPPAQLKALHQTRSDKAFELMLDRRTRQSEIRAVLTPEQRAEWDKLQAYRAGLRQGRRAFGRHDGTGGF